MSTFKVNFGQVWSSLFVCSLSFQHVLKAAVRFMNVIDINQGPVKGHNGCMR